MSDPFQRQVSLGYGTVRSLHNAADAGFAAVGLLRLINRESRAKSSCLREAEADFARRDGGGGNRTRVRGRTGQNVYKLRLPFDLTRQPECSRPTAGPAILRCRAAGDWLSLGAEPVR